MTALFSASALKNSDVSYLHVGIIVWPASRLGVKTFWNSINGSDPDSVRSVDPESGFRRPKMTHKNRKVKKFHVLNCWMFSFEG
jgi:hypothetical protein